MAKFSRLIAMKKRTAKFYISGAHHCFPLCLIVSVGLSPPLSFLFSWQYSSTQVSLKRPHLKSILKGDQSLKNTKLLPVRMQMSHIFKDITRSGSQSERYGG